MGASKQAGAFRQVAAQAAHRTQSAQGFAAVGMARQFLAVTFFGIFQATSQWKGQYELFQYEMSGDEMRLVYGQDGSKDKVKARARKCDEKGMDFCLELSGASRGVKKYYSMEDWVIDGRMDTLDHLRARVQDKLQTPAADD